MVSSMFIEPRANNIARKTPLAPNIAQIIPKKIRSPTMVSMTKRGLICNADLKLPMMLLGTNSP